MTKNDSLEKLITEFQEKGGKIDKFYLNNLNRRPSLVYLNGWYSGQNIRTAIMKAISDQ